MQNTNNAKLEEYKKIWPKETKKILAIVNKVIQSIHYIYKGSAADILIRKHI